MTDPGVERKGGLLYSEKPKHPLVKDRDKSVQFNFKESVVEAGNQKGRGNRLSKEQLEPVPIAGDSQQYRTTSIGHLRGPAAPKHMPLRDKLIMGPLDKYKYYSKFHASVSNDCFNCRQVPLEAGSDYTSCDLQYSSGPDHGKEHS